MSEPLKLYVIKKYVVAINATEAIRISKATTVHEVEMDATWRDLNLPEALGIEIPEE